MKPELKLEAAEREIKNAVPEKDFFKLVAQFIEQANSMNDIYSKEMISTAITYAASRYNAYIVANSCRSKDDYDDSRDQALEYFLEQYEAMFKENFADYLANYNTFLDRRS